MNGTQPQTPATAEMAVAPRKVFTISLEIELGAHKTSKARLQAAYERAVTCSLDAIQSELLPDSVESVTHYMTYDYRHMIEITEEIPAPDGGWLDVAEIEADDIEAQEPELVDASRNGNGRGRASPKR